MNLNLIGNAVASVVKNAADAAMKAAVTTARTTTKAQIAQIIPLPLPKKSEPKTEATLAANSSAAEKTSAPGTASSSSKHPVKDNYISPKTAFPTGQNHYTAPSNWQTDGANSPSSCALPPPPPPPCCCDNPAPQPQAEPAPTPPASTPTPPASTPRPSTPTPPATPAAPQTTTPTASTDEPFKIDAPNLRQRNANGAMQFINPTTGFLIDKIPSWIPNGVDAMFSSNKGQKISLKAFTDKDLLAFGKTKIAENPSVKLHAWAAEKGEISISDSWTTADGTSMRTGTFTITGSIQAEVVGKLPINGSPVKTLITANPAQEIQYSITTSEERLRKIMTGEEKAPDPFTLANMQTGDTVTVSAGTTKYVEAEFRAAVFKAVPGLGLDFKIDKTLSSNTQKFTVKQVKNEADPSRPHVLVMEGDRKGNSQAVGFGLIWDSSMVTGKAPLPDGEKGPPSGFARVLFQAKEGEEVEHFNFVELDPADTTPGGGQDLLNRIMNTGVVADPTASDKIPGSYAYGTLDVDTKTSSATLQLSGFFDPQLLSSQVLGQYSIDLLSSLDTKSTLKVIEGKPGAVSGGTGTIDVAARYSDGGFTNYIHTYRVDPTICEASENMYLTGESTREATLVRGLESGAFQNVRLNLKDGTVLTDSAAIEWLKKHEDKSDGWWFIDGEDKVKAVMNMGIPKDANSFSRRFLDDQKKYHDDQQKGFLNNLLYEFGRSQMMSQEAMLAYLAAPDLFASPDHPFNLGDHQKAETADENFKVMSGSSMANLVDDAADYWKHSGSTEPYPVTIDVFVDYE